jgi:peptide-methionine (R)-S-oxide reductase
MERRAALSVLTGFVLSAPLAARAAATHRPTHPQNDAEWRAALSPAAYRVLREGATEPAFSSSLVAEHRAGTYACAGCRRSLFSSKTKYDAHSGYPSFTAALPGAVKIAAPARGKTYAPVQCVRCDSHVGRLYHDGPKPAGLHYSMNGIALAFLPNSA